MKDFRTNPKYQALKADFLRRCAETKTTRWWRFGIVAAIFIAWVAWLGNWWVILFLFLLFDIYITGYIPFTWWKKSKNKAFVMVMSWVDAILYALILVYFVFTFVGQNYQIPSSSLEKTLLTGDYLWVNKMSYGPRVPMTPIHFPLVQNTMPLLGTKSYIEWPQWRYHRLKGLGNVETGDIVVFNFPAGDTVCLKMQNPDYYILKHRLGAQIIDATPEYQAMAQASPESYTALRDYLGKSYIEQNPQIFGEVIWRPVDRRENYVKRAVGLPGQTIELRDGFVYINGSRQAWPRDAQFNYIFTVSQPVSDSQWEQLGVSVDDRMSLTPNGDLLSLNTAEGTVNYHLTALDTQKLGLNKGGYMYRVPLTGYMLADLKTLLKPTAIMREPAPLFDEYIYPADYSEARGWTRSDMGPMLIPAKGMTVKLSADNWPLYERAIRDYEYHPDSYVRDGRVYIDGKPASEYTFLMDYYFMMGDNRDNSLDSRYWGFVPEDHIVGKPMRVLISFDKDKSLFNGGIRWNRILKDANPGF